MDLLFSDVIGFTTGRLVVDNDVTPKLFWNEITPFSYKKRRNFNYQFFSMIYISFMNNNQNNHKYKKLDTIMRASPGRSKHE